MYHVCSMLNYFIDGAESQEEIEKLTVQSEMVSDKPGPTFSCPVMAHEPRLGFPRAPSQPSRRM